jgi:undecaprenyl-diphosphatase
MYEIPVVDFLNSLDISLFHFINSSLSNPVFDFLMPILTDLNKQRLVLAAVLVLLLWGFVRGKRHVRIALALLIITIIFTDQFNSSVIKHWFERPRPCHSLHQLHLLVSCGSGFSFPSSHAVNNFAGALIIAFFFPRGKWWSFGFASMVAFSRVYVGVHYPFDVIGGAVIGLFCAGIVLLLYSALEQLWCTIQYRRAHGKGIHDRLT